MFYPKKKKKSKPLPLFDKAGVKVKRKPDYKKKLDEVFSKYIRLKYSDEHGYCRCISCGKVHFWKQIQNGHYMSRRHLSTRWSEDNCRPQCVACNIFNQGEAQMYRRNLVAEIGEERVTWIETYAHTTAKEYGEIEYNELIKYYTARVEMLLREKHI
jgi:hypothetical protein